MKRQRSLFFVFCLAGSALGEGEERPFRFEPFAPQTGALKSFYPRGRGKEEAAMLYSAATFPNPFVEPERCAFAARKTHSWLCDPEKLLPPLEEAELELALLRLRDERAHECADGKLHHFQVIEKWGIGNKSCHDGMVLMFVKNHLLVSLVGRARVNLTYLLSGSVGAALITGVELVGGQLPEAPTGA
ncbi:hypothetical protein ETH_00010430 [Eimeria tenella]|uniref:Uncharacterized protein n=1 Tax=Eimeria tenella TaxID=5802 RepID=U6KZB0_EIMTE|nr:hypothetical protein ETH_00010430 [Eimeria tenella]CDJ41664.1 hypothetical protein ETH_00010430 [Eimeria tenella]|eukprot:XP_013232414.1 hypothetical protein ETH_00010430 [Eimeria tenella]